MNMTIATGQSATLCDVRGATVHVREGCVWITQHGSIADEIVHAGYSFAITRNGMTILTACRPGPATRVRIEQPVETEMTLAARVMAVLAMMLPVHAVR